MFGFETLVYLATAQSNVVHTPSSPLAAGEHILVHINEVLVNKEVHLIGNL